MDLESDGAHLCADDEGVFYALRLTHEGRDDDLRREVVGLIDGMLPSPGAGDRRTSDRQEGWVYRVTNAPEDGSFRFGETADRAIDAGMKFDHFSMPGHESAAPVRVNAELLEDLLYKLELLKLDADAAIWSIPAEAERGVIGDARHARTVDLSDEARAHRAQLVLQRAFMAQRQRGASRSSGCWGVRGLAMARAGWLACPQAYSGQRKPVAALPTELRKAGVRPWDLQTWASDRLWDLNSMVLTGPDSGCILAIDIDVTSDPLLSIEVERYADLVLGATPFRRLGKAPKIILLYRLDRASTEAERALFREIKFGPGATVEFLWTGRQFTAYGLHHSTGQQFVWSTDINDKLPSDVPQVTHDQVALLRFMLETRFTTEAKKVGAGDYKVNLAALPEQIGDIVIPSLTGFPVGPAGKISDYREKFATRLAWELIRHNIAASYSETDLEGLTAAAMKGFTAQAERSGPRWTSDGDLYREMKDRVMRASAHTSTMTSARRRTDTALIASAATPAPKTIDPFADADDAFGWLLGDAKFASPVARPQVEGADGVKRVQIVPKTLEAVERDRRDRALLAEIQRRDKHATIHATIDKAFDGFFAETRARSKALHELDGKSQGARRRAIKELEAAAAHLLRVVAGGGKTTRTAKNLVKSLTAEPLPKGQKVLFLLNDYRLAAELQRTFERLGCTLVRSSDTHAPAWELGELRHIHGHARTAGAPTELGRIAARLVEGLADDLRGPRVRIPRAVWYRAHSRVAQELILSAAAATTTAPAYGFVAVIRPEHLKRYAPGMKEPSLPGFRSQTLARAIADMNDVKRRDLSWAVETEVDGDGKAIALIVTASSARFKKVKPSSRLITLERKRENAAIRASRAAMRQAAAEKKAAKARAEPA